MANRITTMKDSKAVLLDLGGTLRRGGEPIPGAERFLRTLGSSGIPYFILSNSTTKSTQSLVNMLKEMDLPVDRDRMITANLVTIDYMKKNNITSAFLIGEEEQKKEFEENGIHVNDKKASAVVVSFDYNLNYEKLAIADYLIRNGAKYIATNVDTHFVTEDGLGPDTAGTIGFLKATTGRDPVITGKPSQTMLETAMKKASADPHEMTIIGDQLEIDMKMAREHNMLSVLVLSGKTTRDDLACSAFQPDYVVESVENLTPLFA